MPNEMQTVFIHSKKEQINKNFSYIFSWARILSPSVFVSQKNMQNFFFFFCKNLTYITTKLNSVLETVAIIIESYSVPM